jgi:hypothetical protein
MTIEKIQDVTNDISENLKNEAIKTGKVAEDMAKDISSEGKSFLEAQLDTFTELTNIAVEGVEKMVELNMEAIKESIDGSMVATDNLLVKTGNAITEKMESASEEAVDTTKTNVAKATDKAKEVAKIVAKK